jgi:NADH-quinone oxidoreductase subunit G
MEQVTEQSVTLTIDGRSVSVPPGTLLIRAAERLGIEIPRFCDHPLLAPAGACRQCLVEITDAGNGRGFPKPQPSCTIPVADGMVVETASPAAAKAQAGILEFLLINHPLDCPVCDKGGECPLQNQSMEHGRGESRFHEPKRTWPKPIPISETILLDRERCVLCQRCTRFAAEIADEPTLVLLERGGHQQVGTADGRPFDSPYAGNVIDLCPVGALTSADYRFRSRPFDLVSTDSIAEHDACGAAIRVDHRGGVVVRRVARTDPEVNEEWITDRDRFGFHYLTAPERLTEPLVRVAGELRPATWPEAIAAAAGGLPTGATGVLTGGRITLEDAQAYAAFAREVLATDDIDFRARPVSEEESDFLRAVVRGSASVTYADLLAADVVALVALDPRAEAGTIDLRLIQARKRGVLVTTLPGRHTKGSPEQPERMTSGRGLTERSVVLVGERAAHTPGAIAEARRAAEAAGARIAWVPLRAGDRGALEAGCLPLEGGRDTGRMIAAARDGDLEALLLGGVPASDDLVEAARTAFTVCLELRRTAVTEVADVVLPVAPVTDKAGTFVTWEGRERPFPQVFDRPGSYADARVIASIRKVLS